METERLQYKKRVDREKFLTELKLLKFHFIEFLVKEVVALFKGDSEGKKSK
jgi:hypothetical protein